MNFTYLQSQTNISDRQNIDIFCNVFSFIFLFSLQIDRKYDTLANLKIKYD